MLFMFENPNAFHWVFDMFLCRINAKVKPFQLLRDQNISLLCVSVGVLSVQCLDHWCRGQDTFKSIADELQ